MLTITPIRAPERASDHLACVHRYGSEAPPVTAWFGAGAAARGLSGPVDGAQLEALLDGRINERTLLGRRRGGERDHRPGWELMFSAPKSVSLATLVGDDAQLVEAHDAAALEALGWLQQNALATRLRDGGKPCHYPTGCLLAAIVRHEISRAAEPHLHSRVLVVNATLAGPEKWRSIVSLPLYVAARTAGIRYQQTLAGYAGILGYDIAWRGLDRRTASAKQRERATRQAEAVQSPRPGEQQRQHDRTRARHAGFDLEAFVDHARQAARGASGHPPSIEGSTVDDPSAALPTTRREAL